MTRMNSATSIAPNSSPEFQTLIAAVLGASMPYRPLIGAISESTMIRWGFWLDPVVGARDRLAVRVEVVHAGRDDVRQRAP